MAQKPKHGDVVHMKGTVSDPAIPASVDDIFRVRIGDALHWVPVSEIVHVEPAPLKVGDSVAWRGDAANGVIIAIDRTTEPLMAWVRGGIGTNNYGILVVLDELKRADEPRPLKVGDKVRHANGWYGTVTACDDGLECQIRLDTGVIKYVVKSNLERVE